MSAQSDPMSEGSDDEWVTDSGSTDSQIFTIFGDGSSDMIERIQQLVQQTPREHPDFLRYQQILGIMYGDKYNDSEDLDDLEASLQNFQTAVDLSQGHPGPERAECLANLAVAFTARYQKLGELEDLEAALQNDQQAVQLTPKEHPDRANRLENLAISFTDRYQTLGEITDLEAALEHLQEAVELPLPEDHDIARRFKGLAMSFRKRYKRLGELKDLEAALQNFEQAVDLTPQEPYRAGHLQNLALAFTDRYQRLGELKDLEIALQKDQEAVDLTPKDDFDRAARLQSLGISFRNRYQRLGQLADHEAALQHLQEAVELTHTDDAPKRAEHLQNLAACLGDKYKRLEDLEDLEASLQRLQEALSLLPEGGPDRAGCLRNIAVSLAHRYQRLGQVSDLEAALQKDREALDLTSEGDSDRAAYLQQLAVSVRDRFQRLAELGDLQTALEKSQEVLDLTPQGHPNRARYLQSFALALRDRYQRLGDLKDLETALPKLQEAVDLIPKEHPDRAGYLQSLSVAFSDRYKRLKELKDLEAALRNDQEALDLTPEGPGRAGRLQSLAMSFRDRYLRSENLTDLEAALQKFQEAVDLTPKGHADKAERLQSLARSFSHRYTKLGDEKDLKAALKYDQEAVDLTPEGHPAQAGRLQQLALSFQEHYVKFKEPSDLSKVHICYRNSFKAPMLNPEAFWTAALEWGSFATEFDPSKCLPPYMTAFKVLPEILWIGHSVDVQHNAIRRLDIGQATSTAVKMCIDLGDLTSAVEIMEQGLATIFQQMLQLKTDVDKLPSEQAEKLKNYSSELYSRKSANPLALVIERNKLLDHIRGQPGFEDFLCAKKYQALCEAAQGGPIIILNSNEDCCDGIIIPNPTSEPIHVPLPDVTLELLESQRILLKELLQRCNVRTRGESSSTRLFGRQELFSSKTTTECFTDMLLWLWTHIVSPVFQHLKSHEIHSGRLWWLPTGAFTGLPLHACSPTDQFIHSYTATLGTLLDAYDKKTSNIAPRVGLVGVTHTGSGRMNYLKGVEKEVEKILSIIPKSQIDCVEGPQATVDAVTHQLQTCSWVHLACHGKQDLIDPTKSYLKLYGGSLELDTILQMPLSDAQFVFLAACQTAMGDSVLVNESFHLGGGFIAAGFRGAIGTLWSMNDLDGPLVSEIVYSQLFRNGGQAKASDAAEALQMAVNKLKAQNVGYERWIPFIHLGV